MKTALLHIRGLFDSDPNGDWCGARARAEDLANRKELALFSRNWDDSEVEHVVDWLRQCGYDWIALTGHSHGAWRVGEIAKWYEKAPLDFIGLLDYCPFLDPFAQMGPPLLFPPAAKYGYAVWQHNATPTGCKFNARQNVICEDATGWTAPKLGHVDFPMFDLASIAGDARVWASLEKQLDLARDKVADFVDLQTGH